jgi:hypothetical protein
MINRYSHQRTLLFYKIDFLGSTDWTCRHGGIECEFCYLDWIGGCTHIPSHPKVHKELCDKATINSLCTFCITRYILPKINTVLTAWWLLLVRILVRYPLLSLGYIVV